MTTVTARMDLMSQVCISWSLITLFIERLNWVVAAKCTCAVYFQALLLVPTAAFIAPMQVSVQPSSPLLASMMGSAVI